MGIYREVCVHPKIHNCLYKRDVLTFMHFARTNPRFVLYGSSQFCPYIQICSYKHGPYMPASLYVCNSMEGD